jgi:hypothetical protein
MMPLRHPWRGAHHEAPEEICKGQQMKILITATLDEWGVDTLSHIGEVPYEGFADKKRLPPGGKLVRALVGFEVFVTEVDQVRARALEQVDLLPKWQV